MRLKELVEELHSRSVWQVLTVYVVTAAVGYQLIEALVSGLGLPGWFPALAVVLFIIGLPIVLATAVVQRGGPVSRDRDPTLLPEAHAVVARESPGERAGGMRRWFTWRNAILGGLLAFSVWGIVATGWLLVSDRDAGSTSVAAESGRQKLVVLPFENLGPTEHEYFADGITEEITSRLAAIGDLGVISRTSAIHYKDSNKPLPEIGQELGVDYVLEGTILWQQATDGPSRVRVTPQLIRVDDDTHVWADRYDAVLSDIFSVQSEIAAKVIGALNIALGEGERASLEARPTENLEAYDYYLRGKDYSVRSVQRQDLELAVELFDRAIELDPDFAAAHAQRALASDYLYWFYDRDRDRLPSIKASAERALELDPDLPDGHIALGYYYYHGQLDYERALEELARARALRPNDAALWEVIAYVQRRQGRFEASVQSMDRAMELDPLSSRMAWSQCQTLELLREFARATEQCRRSIVLAPDVADGYAALAGLHLQAGALEANRELLNSATARGLRTTLVRDLAKIYVFHPLFRSQPEYARALADLEMAEFEEDTFIYYLSRTSLFGQTPAREVEVAYLDSARLQLKQLRDSPGAPITVRGMATTLLGLTYAYLGWDRDALRAAREAAELVTVSTASLEGLLMLEDLATVYVLVGMHDEALEQLEQLLSRPSYMSVARLRADPVFDPLRDDPRFQALLSRYGS